jgi:hypothetical protein
MNRTILQTICINFSSPLISCNKSELRSGAKHCIIQQNRRIVGSLVNPNEGHWARKQSYPDGRKNFDEYPQNYIRLWSVSGLRCCFRHNHSSHRCPTHNDSGFDACWPISTMWLRPQLWFLVPNCLSWWLLLVGLHCGVANSRLLCTCTTE